MSDDVLEMLKADHHAAETVLKRFNEIPVAGRDEYFCEVVQTLVGHEVAEEVVIYPVVRESSVRGEEVARGRLAEQAEAEELLNDMEHDDTSSDVFTEKFMDLRDAVLAHASAEEATVFPILEAETTVEQRMDLGARYRKAKDSAPTHPHPHAPDTPPGNKIVGPIAAVFDRARDAVGRT